MGTFAQDVVVEPLGADRYRATLDDSWDLVAVPQGGIVVAMGLRAAESVVGPKAGTLRSCSAAFAGRVSSGELSIGVEVLRRGRTATQVAVDVRNAGESAGTRILAVFGSGRDGPTFVDVTPPSVLPPNECRSYRDPLPEGVDPFVVTGFWTRIEGRAALGHAPWEQFEPSGSDVANWYRFDDPPLLDDGSLDPLGVLTLADRMPGSVGERLGGRQERQWFAPSADLTVHLFEPLRTEWLLAHDRARWADNGWASAETMLFDEVGTLIGYATQMMIFTYL